MTAPFASPEGFNTAMSGDAESFVNGAIGVVTGYCGWHIAPVLTTRHRLNGCGGVELDVPTQRLVSLVSAINDGVPLDVNGIDFSEDGTLSLRSGSWSRRLGGITVVMEHGYKLEEAREVIELTYAIARRAQANRRGKVQSGVDSVQSRFGTYAGGGAGGFAPFQQEYKVLDRYKLRV